MHNINLYLGNDPTVNHYVDSKSSFGYQDISSIKKNFPNDPIFLSINVQSLNSKFEKLRDFLNNLSELNLNIAAVALQELWQLPHPDLFKINNFELITKLRPKGRGGGVGFYVREDLLPKIIYNLSYFIEGVFECISIEISITKKCNYLPFTDLLIMIKL